MHSKISAVIKNICLFVAIFITPICFAQLPLDAFIQGPSLLDTQVSPNGQYLAEVHDKGNGVRIVTIRDLSLPTKSVIGSIGDNVVRASSVFWANDERLIIKAYRPQNIHKVRKKLAENTDFDINDYVQYSRLFSVNIHGKDAVLMMENERDVRGVRNLSTIRHFLPNDPDHILMSTFRKGLKTLFKVNVFTGKAERVIKGKRFTYLFLSDVNGKPQYRVDYRHIAQEIIIYRYLGDDEWDKFETIYLEERSENNVDISELFGLFGDELVYRKLNQKTGYYELLGYNSLTKKQRIIVSLPEQSIYGVVINRRSDDVIGYMVEKDNIRHKYFNSKSQALYDTIAKQIGEYNFVISSSSDDKSVMVVFAWGLDNPGGYFIYNNKTQQLELHDFSYDVLPIEQLSFSAKINYLTRDKQALRAYVLLPLSFQAKKPLPMVILPHGGPQSRSRASYNDFAQFLSTRGYIVVMPNFRGSTGYGQDFEQAGYKQWGQLMQDDITDAVGYMVKKGYADANKVCIAGISYGGYAALMGAIKTPELYQCSVSINGVTHLREMIDYDIDVIDDDEFIEKYLYQRIGHPRHDRIMLDENSPALQANQMNTPLLLIASEDDDIVPYEQAELMIGGLKKHHKPFEFFKIKEGVHNPFDTLENRKVVYDKVDKFLAQYLQ